MKEVGSLIAAPLKALGLIHTPSAAAAPVVLPTATRDTIREDDSALDELRRRKGGAADILTDPGGAESSGGGKVQLG